MKKVMIAGGSGFIGRHLSEELKERGIPVIWLTRSVEKGELQEVGEYLFKTGWDGESAEGWVEQAAGCDVIINLAGESVAGGLWTQNRKERIIDSRVKAGEALLAGIKQMKKKPTVFLQASAVGYYGDRGDTIINEDSEPGEGFLAETGKKWEASTREIDDMNIRRVIMRIGLVLGEDGGMLSKLKPLFKMFAGGHPGNGRQYMPWIHIKDITAAMQHLIENRKSEGVYNLTAPSPERASSFFKKLGKAFSRPSWLHPPGFLLKTIMPGMADEMLLSGQRALPAHLEREDFRFKYRTLEEALKDLTS